MSVVWCNGTWEGAAAAGLSWTDRGLQHGLGLFETILAVEGRPVFLERHLVRLRSGLDRLGWEMPGDDLSAVMGELLVREGLIEGRARVRLAVTGGSGPLGEGRQGGDRCVWLMASALGDPVSGVALTISPWRRNAHSAVAGLKCAAYAENLIALQQAQRVGFDDALWLNTEGQLCEATMANVFVVTQQKLLTPSLDSGCLPGITRGVVMELARDLRLSCEEGVLMPDVLDVADQIFLTSSTRGVVPVVRIQERVLPAGGVVSLLQKAWAERVAAECAG